MAWHNKAIRQEIVPASTSMFFDVECEEYDNITVIWCAASANTNSPTYLICCPTSERSGSVPTPFANYPNVPGNPLAGYVVYMFLGLNSASGIILPNQLTIGVVNPAGCAITIKAIGLISLNQGGRPDTKNRA